MYLKSMALMALHLFMTSNSPHSHSHMHACTHARAHTHPHTHTCMHACARMHAHTHARLHACMCTRLYTTLLSLPSLHLSPHPPHTFSSSRPHSLQITARSSTSQTGSPCKRSGSPSVPLGSVSTWMWVWSMAPTTSSQYAMHSLALSLY